MAEQRQVLVAEARTELAEASRQIEGYVHAHTINPFTGYVGHSQGAERYTPDKQALRALHRAVEKLAEAVEADAAECPASLAALEQRAERATRSALRRPGADVQGCLERDSVFVPVPRDQDPYFKGEGGNCGFTRVSGDACPDCWRRDGEWHQGGCPAEKVKDG